ncbi:hypothetical protein FORC065_2520 [Yersinia enterocolitica]|nr:hypothetical protein FORC065_2520 [Yersinia enterocolitica]
MTIVNNMRHLASTTTKIIIMVSEHSSLPLRYLSPPLLFAHHPTNINKISPIF